MKGELVCILLGAPTPFILCKDCRNEYGSRAFILLGESYIHGLMRGEGMNMVTIQEIKIS